MGGNATCAEASWHLQQGLGEVHFNRSATVGSQCTKLDRDWGLAHTGRVGSRCPQERHALTVYISSLNNVPIYPHYSTPRDTLHQQCRDRFSLAQQAGTKPWSLLTLNSLFVKERWYIIGGNLSVGRVSRTDTAWQTMIPTTDATIGRAEADSAHPPNSIVVSRYAPYRSVVRFSDDSQEGALSEAAEQKINKREALE